MSDRPAVELPTPHLEKLNAVLANPRLPDADRPRLEQAKKRYGQWVQRLSSVVVDDNSDVALAERVRSVVEEMTPLLNEYKRYIDLDITFDSPANFLYRQKGQTKLDNSILEEFLPHLVSKCVLESTDVSIEVGPKKAFSAVYFTSSLDNPHSGGGLHVRTKDQDFVIARRVFLKASYSPGFDEAETKDFYIAYVAAECKTNLDKTMFQEACATAHDVKSAVAGSRYYLLCEWLDMLPQSTAATDIDEVLILRCAKRMASNDRRHFGTVEGRREHRQMFIDCIDAHPYSVDVLQRFVEHIIGLLTPIDPVEDDVLSKGFF